MTFRSVCFDEFINAGTRAGAAIATFDEFKIAGTAAIATFDEFKIAGTANAIFGVFCDFCVLDDLLKIAGGTFGVVVLGVLPRFPNAVSSIFY
jgi:hypothetical protein